MSLSGRPTANEWGFALLGVLWIAVAMAALAMTISLIARESVLMSQNRMSLIRAGWHAEDCLERARLAMTDLHNRQRSRESDTPLNFDHLRAEMPLRMAAAEQGPCTIELEAAGHLLDVNTADEVVLQRLLILNGILPLHADSLVNALLHWRDGAFTAPSPGMTQRRYEFGEEFTSMRSSQMRRFVDSREIRQVEGWGELTHIHPFLGVESGRIALNYAPLALLAALPGLTPEAIGLIAEKRGRGERLSSLLELTSDLSPTSRDSVLLNQGDLLRRTTVEPDAWVLTSWGEAGSPAVQVVVQLRLVWSGGRAAIVRRRTWVS